MKIVLRIPTKPQYSFAEVQIDATDKADALSQLAAVDSELSEAIRDAVEHATAVALLKTELGATEVKSDKPWARKAEAPKKVDVPDLGDFWS